MVADEEQWKYGHPKLHKVAANTYWRGVCVQLSLCTMLLKIETKLHFSLFSSIFSNIIYGGTSDKEPFEIETTSLQRTTPLVYILPPR